MLTWLINKIINKWRLVLVQGLRFATVGLINTLLDYAIYISLTRLTEYFSVHYLQANAISFGTAVICSFLMNYGWTFANKKVVFSWLLLLKYILIMWLGSFVIAQSALYYAVEHWQVYDLIGKLIGVFLGFLWNFFMSRRWVFNHV
ncbi:MAG: GtrA family protein [Candidatus Komeilibacteria bacterium]